MVQKTLRGGWLDCVRKGTQFSCELVRSDGHIIENKGGKFKVKSMRLQDLNTQAWVAMDQKIVHLSPGLDKIIECDIFDSDIAQCSIIR